MGVVSERVHEEAGQPPGLLPLQRNDSRPLFSIVSISKVARRAKEV